MIGIVVVIVLVAVGFAYLAWYVWDAYRPRGTIMNPLWGSGKRATVPTTAALRRARRETTPAVPYVAVAWRTAPAPWPTPVEEGQVVELRYLLRPGQVVEMRDREGVGQEEVYRLRVVARAPRLGDGRRWMDYLGEAIEAEPFRSSFSDDKIWGVEEEP